MVNITHFSPDPKLAKQLGFLYFGLSGSRAYKEGNWESLRENADWDFVGMVESKNDIVSLALQKKSQICDLLGIFRAECLSWEVIINIRSSFINRDSAHVQKTDISVITQLSTDFGTPRVGSLTICRVE